ncbi:MAG: site-specific recombinase [Cytophagaceae bacterium]
MTLTDLLNLLPKIKRTDSLLLKKIIAEIRPANAANYLSAEKKLYSLVELINQDPQTKSLFNQYICGLFEGKNIILLLSNSGILSNAGFFKEVKRKINEAILPPLYKDSDLVKVVTEVFHKKKDHLWVSNINEEVLQKLLHIILADNTKTFADLTNQTRKAMLVLSHRLASLGLEPEITDKLPESDYEQSPFLKQNLLMDAFLASGDFTPENVSLIKLRQTLAECADTIHTIRINRNIHGASLDLTYILQRITQIISRINILLYIIAGTKEEKEIYTIRLFKQIVKAENKKNSFSEFLTDNMELLAFQITEHAGKTGEHYITSNEKEYKSMFRSALGGGFIVGFLTIIKTAIYYLKLPLFGQAFMYSMNYSIGFMTIHLTHATLATKQPAMTASKIAATLDAKEGEEKSLRQLANLIAKISRSQFIALIGNVIIAFPVAFILCWIYYFVTGDHLADPEKAFKMIEEINPIRSLSLFHASIAGVYLFIAGLISGYYDNKNVYSKISQRIACHNTLKRLIGHKSLQKVANYIDKNLGSLAGNFFFGIFLGSTGVLGIILGLPIDIRHITFASGNFGIAMASIGDLVSTKTILVSVAGILAIGVVNLIVSFGLALFVAIRSRKVNFNQSRKLLWLVLKMFIQNPSEFFVPPPQKSNTNEEDKLAIEQIEEKV